MTLEKFNQKHQKLIQMGVITFDEMFGIHFIIIDRYKEDEKIFLCGQKELNAPRSDVRKMGYTRRMIGIGHYGKNIES